MSEIDKADSDKMLKKEFQAAATAAANAKVNSNFNNSLIKNLIDFFEEKFQFSLQKKSLFYNRKLFFSI